METKDFLTDPPRRTRTPQIHNLHARIPIALWKRFRRSFPEKGDVARIVQRSLEMYLAVYERRKKREEDYYSDRD